MAIAWRPVRRSASNAWRRARSRRSRSRRRSGANGAKNNTATGTTATAETPGRHVGRFAPSPTGDLHLGSLYGRGRLLLDARANGAHGCCGSRTRSPARRAQTTAQILRTLAEFGFEWDGAVLFQSQRASAYADKLRSQEAEPDLRVHVHAQGTPGTAGAGEEAAIPALPGGPVDPGAPRRCASTRAAS